MRQEGFLGEHQAQLDGMDDQNQKGYPEGSRRKGRGSETALARAYGLQEVHAQNHPRPEDQDSKGSMEKQAGRQEAAGMGRRSEEDSAGIPVLLLRVRLGDRQGQGRQGEEGSSTTVEGLSRERPRDARHRPCGSSLGDLGEAAAE